MPVLVCVQCQQIVLGKSIEYSDFDNPRGYVYGTTARVVLFSSRGRRWVYVRGFNHRSQALAVARADRFRLRVETHLATGGKLKRAQWVAG